MLKDLSIKKIQSKFRELVQLDQTKRGEAYQQIEVAGPLLPSLESKTPKQDERAAHLRGNYLQNKKQATKELIFTKSDICREVAKLKPYLKQFKQTLTTVQQQDIKNKEISEEEKNRMSDLIIYFNKKLCEWMSENTCTLQKNQMRRENKEKEGWIYEVFYRINPNIEGPVELSAVRFKNGYIILTEIVDLYPDLTFQDSILKININQVRRIKYFEELEFHIISIRFQQSEIHIGFLNEVQMKLFDRMLFLIRNMARTSSTRLFQNQLMKNIYSQF